jgi:ribose 5-phosphate isomerase B
MKIVIGSDHRGFNLKCYLKNILAMDGHEVEDVGCYSASSSDYPEYAKRACVSILDGKAQMGILICGTGLGMAMAANRFKGIRAAPCRDLFTARYSRLHNDANVLCLGAEVTGEGLAHEIVSLWIETPFSKEERHLRRIEMLER